MATFAFKALDLSGSATRGEIDADDKQAVAAQLRGKGLTVVTRQFATMISSGMSMLRTLYVLEEQVENDKLKEALSQVRKDVEAGIALSDALARHPDIFDELYVAMVAAGESGGIIEETLR